jgi:hypothetical protein
VTDEDRLKVLASKLVTLTEDDCMSYGAAARGHILEPYAVKALNDILGYEKFYHWDDIVVTNTTDTILGFSPDAADVPMTGLFTDATAIAEIKSYSDEKHVCRCHTPKMECEERWQIAHAMATRSHLIEAYLVFFNPRIRDNRYVTPVTAFQYSRSELGLEISTIKKIVDDWKDFILNITAVPLPLLSGSCEYSEQGIYEIEEEKAGLNP